MLEYYYCRYDIEDLIHASEIHKPKIQTTVIGQQRLVHFHLAVSKYDIKTGNQIRMTPYRHDADKAFQSHLAMKYGLEDPAKHIRPNGKPSLDDLRTRQTGDIELNAKTEKPTLPMYKQTIAALLADVESVKEAKFLLNGQEDITSVVLKKMKKKDKKTGKLVPGNKYLQIKSILFPGTRSINLRGKGFENLEELYYTPEETAARILAGEFKPTKILSDDDAQAIYKKHQDWWLEEARKLEKKQAPINIDYKKIEKKYAAKFEKKIKAQRVYFVIYKKNIELEQIQGYEIWENNNTRFLLNNDLGIQIYDRKDKIVLQIPDDPEKRRRAVSLALSIAQDKGWDLQAMNITGSEAFRKETQRQIDERYKPTKPIEEEPLPVEPKLYINVIQQLQSDRADKKALQKITPGRIKDIKDILAPRAVIDYAIENFELPGQFYSVYKMKIDDSRTTRKSKNVIDFLTKTCNQPVSDAFKILDNLLQEQNRTQEKLDQRIDDLPGLSGYNIPQIEQTEIKTKDDLLVETDKTKTMANDNKDDYSNPDDDDPDDDDPDDDDPDDDDNDSGLRM